ncbi:ECT2L [Bugula neritina]|uniref:ECT2L n=1 Tax=Bugula neritina TaxID=10212 RepID=A0A7J7IRW7_BUGNE|nr:ECT2L [Bugula neritina]
MSSYLSTKSKMKRLEITNDDSKVLGKTPTRFVNKSADHFVTKKYQTYNSAWTPVNHKPSNEQVLTVFY